MSGEEFNAIPPSDLPKDLRRLVAQFIGPTENLFFLSHCRYHEEIRPGQTSTRTDCVVGLTSMRFFIARDTGAAISGAGDLVRMISTSQLPNTHVDIRDTTEKKFFGSDKKFLRFSLLKKPECPPTVFTDGEIPLHFSLDCKSKGVTEPNYLLRMLLTLSTLRRLEEEGNSSTSLPLESQMSPEAKHLALFFAKYRPYREAVSNEDDIALLLARCGEAREIDTLFHTLACRHPESVNAGHRKHLIWLWAEYAPDKIVGVDKKLIFCRGKEAEMMQREVAKWGPEPPRVSEVRSGPPSESHLRRLMTFAEAYHCTDGWKIGELLRDNAGCEEVLFERLVTEHGPEPPSANLLEREEFEALSERQKVMSLLNPSNVVNYLFAATAVRMKEALPMCEACHTKAAVVYCMQDNAKLCEACDRDLHAKSRIYERHNRFMLSEMQQQYHAFTVCDEIDKCERSTENEDPNAGVLCTVSSYELDIMAFFHHIAGGTKKEPLDWKYALVALLDITEPAWLGALLGGNLFSTNERENILSKITRERIPEDEQQLRFHDSLTVDFLPMVCRNISAVLKKLPCPSLSSPALPLMQALNCLRDCHWDLSDLTVPLVEHHAEAHPLTAHPQLRSVLFSFLCIDDLCQNLRPTNSKTCTSVSAVRRVRDVHDDRTSVHRVATSEVKIPKRGPI